MPTKPVPLRRGAQGLPHGATSPGQPLLIPWGETAETGIPRTLLCGFCTIHPK